MSQLFTCDVCGGSCDYRIDGQCSTCFYDERSRLHAQLAECHLLLREAIVGVDIDRFRGWQAATLQALGMTKSELVQAVHDAGRRWQLLNVPTEMERRVLCLEEQQRLHIAEIDRLRAERDDLAGQSEWRAQEIERLREWKTSNSNPKTEQ